MPGPLPNANRRRRNAPTIASTLLPSAGRAGRAPNPPKSYELGEAGRAWWRWAWGTPQATQWGGSSLYTCARRAQLEDDLATLAALDADLDLAQLLGIADDGEAHRRLEGLVKALKRMVGGSVSVMKEARELDKRLGLDPKALAELRWTVAEPEPEPDAPADAAAPVRRLRAIEA